MTIWSISEGIRGRRRLALGALGGAMPFLTSGYQVAAETSARSLGGQAFGPAWLARLMTLPSTWALLVLEAVSFAVWMLVLSQMKLSAAFALSAVGYVLVILASWLLFHERADLFQVAGGAAILAGVWLIGRPGEQP
ncbi:SMR family transporter [Phenylobacterium sp.]|jgi:multidrug transporter EmrE-like cation transporter|uniref:SMR family transporter n=1 Tax=Phenylobacterium sp. TaxID=1871053 RepID=UPI002F406A02